MAEPTILVTNDDGIDSVGFRRLFDALKPLGEVVAVAPATNRSAVGRAIEPEARVEEHPLGFVVEGTPAACVIAGVTALDIEPDVIVSGINKGANLGASVLTRSGTVGAAIEAAYMGIPAVASSMYIPFDRIEGDFHDYRSDPTEFDAAAEVTERIVDRVLADGMQGADYLNINAPIAGEVTDARIRVTTPATGYHTIAERDGDRLTLVDRQFELLYTDDLVAAGRTDRAAIAAGEISVSPLHLPMRSVEVADLEAFSAAFADIRRSPSRSVDR